MKNKDGVDLTVLPGTIEIEGETQHVLPLNPPVYINGFLVKYVLVSPKINAQQR